MVAKGEFTRNRRFCMNHLCYRHCCDGCLERNHSVRIYYAHVEHTGGSTIECAAVDLANQGLFIGMGHSFGGAAALQTCREKCGAAPLAVSVRNPYKYHETLYRWTRINPGLIGMGLSHPPNGHCAASASGCAS
jgi:hypothetical protein